MRQNGHQLSIVAREQPAWYVDRTARYCDGFVEIESAPVRGKRRVGRRILGWLPAVANQEAVLEPRAMRRQPAADSLQARFGSRGHAAGLQLRNESFAHLSFSCKRIIIVVRSGGLLGIRQRGGGQEERKLHRNSVRLKGHSHSRRREKIRESRLRASDPCDDLPLVPDAYGLLLEWHQQRLQHGVNGVCKGVGHGYSPPRKPLLEIF